MHAKLSNRVHNPLAQCTGAGLLKAVGQCPIRVARDIFQQVALVAFNRQHVVKGTSMKLCLALAVLMLIGGYIGMQKALAKHDVRIETCEKRLDRLEAPVFNPERSR